MKYACSHSHTMNVWIDINLGISKSKSEYPTPSSIYILCIISLSLLPSLCLSTSLTHGNHIFLIEILTKKIDRQFWMKRKGIHWNRFVFFVVCSKTFNWSHLNDNLLRCIRVQTDFLLPPIYLSLQRSTWQLITDGFCACMRFCLGFCFRANSKRKKFQ